MQCNDMYGFGKTAFVKSLRLLKNGRKTKAILYFIMYFIDDDWPIFFILSIWCNELSNGHASIKYADKCASNTF